MDLGELIGERRGRGDRRRRHHPLAPELAKAIARDGVEVLFQPQFSARDDSLIGAEALVRWRHEQFGEMAGDALFEIAEISGLSDDLSSHVRRKALSYASTWPEKLRLSLNVTAFDLAQDNFPDRLLARLTQAGFALDRLTLEITEQALVDELDSSAATLARLVEHGIRIALDDFGAGFCNFRYLKVLPLHALKLDRSMIDGIERDRRDLEVLRGIVAMASALDLDVLAEGVETAAQRDAIMREGCTAWQGFLGARPMAPDRFASLLSANS